jgi:hypothetical protein
MKYQANSIPFRDGAEDEAEAIPKYHWIVLFKLMDFISVSTCSAVALAAVTQSISNRSVFRI